MTKAILYTAILTFTLSACSSGATTDGGKPLLTVSIEPQRKMLEDIVGDRYEVVSILGDNTNAETYEPSVGQRKALDKSKGFFITGYLPFESKLTSTVDPAVTVVDTSVGITPVTGTHGHADGTTHTEAADPHVWSSYPNAIIMVKTMGKAMNEIDPDNAKAYNEKVAEITHRLDSLNSAAKNQLAESGAHAFAVWHPSLSYYARDYGLHQITVGNEGKEMSAGSMRHAIEEARADSVTTLFFQREYDLRQAETINKEIGSRIVEINPLSYDWENELMHITDELAR